MFRSWVLNLTRFKIRKERFTVETQKILLTKRYKDRFLVAPPPPTTPKMEQFESSSSLQNLESINSNISTTEHVSQSIRRSQPEQPTASDRERHSRLFCLLDSWRLTETRVWLYSYSCYSWLTAGFHRKRKIQIVPFLVVVVVVVTAPLKIGPCTVSLRVVLWVSRVNRSFLIVSKRGRLNTQERNILVYKQSLTDMYTPL